MEKAITLVQRFGLFAQKPAQLTEKDDMFTLRLKRLRKVHAQQAARHLFRTQPAQREA